MTNPLLSIIVPVYNVEPYLQACLESILNQTFKDYELILVDDGSPDNCGSICDEYARKDNRITVIHKKNGGLSSARNAGLDIAKGDYITFVDSDDELGTDTTYEENICILLANKEIDVLQYPTFWGCNLPHGHLEIPLVQIIKGKNIFFNWYKPTGKINHSTWNKIFKRYIFNNIRFPEGKIYEDTYCVPQLAKEVQCLYISNKGYYKYFSRENSIVHSKNNIKKSTDWLNAIIPIYIESCKYKELESDRIELFLSILRTTLNDQSILGRHVYSQFERILKSNTPSLRTICQSMFKFSFLRTCQLLLIKFVGIKIYGKVRVIILNSLRYIKKQ